MDFTSLAPLGTVVIALVAIFTGLGLIFSWLLSPVKENQVRIERVLSDIQKDLADNKNYITRVELQQNNNTTTLNKLLNSYSDIYEIIKANRDAIKHIDNFLQKHYPEK